MKTNLKIILLALVALCAVAAFAADEHTSTQFQGPKANKGTVTHSSRVGAT